MPNSATFAMPSDTGSRPRVHGPAHAMLNIASGEEMPASRWTPWDLMT